MNSNPITLDGLLEKYKHKNGEEITHTRIGNPKYGVYGGKFSIPEEEINTFWKLYHKKVFTNGKECYLVEAQLKDAGPVLIDIDERYGPDIQQRQHEFGNMFDLLELYVEKIREYVIWEENTYENTINAFILEKPKANTSNDEYTKDGIHIVINMSIPYGVQVAIRNEVLKELGNIFEDLPLTNDYDSLLDSRISTGINKWQIFGARKPGNDAYQLKHMYDLKYEDDDIVFEEVSFGDKDMINILPIISARNYHAQKAVLKDEAIEIAKNYKNIKKKKRIRIISKGNKQSKLFTISSFATIDTPEKCEEAINHILQMAKDHDNYDIIMAHDLVKILDGKYFEPYDKWMEVGWALKAISPLLYPVWLGFSSRSDKFDWVNNDCFHLWNEHGGNGSLTMGSLKYWARECNSAAYTVIRDSCIEHHIDKQLRDGESEYDVAKLTHAIYEGNFVCTNIKKAIWYEFKNGRWIEVDSGTTLRHNLSKRVHQIYASKTQKLIARVTEEEESGSDKAKELACEIFFNPDFLNELDKNTELLCFNNGVLDMKEKRFRECRPDDYLSLCTNTDYVAFDENNIEHCEIREEIIEFFEQLFPNPELNKYIWEHLASVLVGDNRNQDFNIYNGCGRNGKSKLVELMGLVLGDYKGSVPLALITQKRGSIGGVSPEIAQLKGIRYAVMQEPSAKTKLNEGIMKELTGGDPIQGRALFKDTVTFNPQLSLVVCTNHLFEINSLDDGTWRRIKICNFESKFVDNPSENPKDKEFKVDRKIDEKFKRWVPILTSMLVEKLFETNGMVTPCKAVMASTLKYKDNQDNIGEFVKQRIIKMEGAKMKKRDVLAEYQEWYAENESGKPSSGKELYEYLNKVLGEPTKLIWVGWRLLHAHDITDDMDIQPNGL
jgi:P4 family phage/plasmid primase-like protien